MNNLTKEELERLALLAEECGEVQQIIGKIIRHGYESFSPFDDDQISNRRLLEKELGDIEFACRLMIKAEDINRLAITKGEAEKAVSAKKYLHHQGQYFDL